MPLWHTLSNYNSTMSGNTLIWKINKRAAEKDFQTEVGIYARNSIHFWWKEMYKKYIQRYEVIECIAWSSEEIFPSCPNIGRMREVTWL